MSTDAPSAPARLLVTRDRPEDVQKRQVFVSLDGTSIGDLVFGERLTREMAPGPHTLRVHNTLFWKTIAFECTSGEEVHFSTVNYSGRGFLNLALILGVAPLFLKVERVEGQ
jgi:hypothetical protein